MIYSIGRKSYEKNPEKSKSLDTKKRKSTLVKKTASVMMF